MRLQEGECIQCEYACVCVCVCVCELNAGVLHVLIGLLIYASERMGIVRLQTNVGDLMHWCQDDSHGTL